MDATKKKLLCLNLALLLALMLALPAAASVRTGYPEKQPPANRFTAVPVGGITPLSDEAEAYNIYVDGTTLSSDTDASGAGWTYTAATNTLALSSYNGGEIFAQGDLTVTSSGTSFVAGTFYHGISATGDLDVRVLSGSLFVYGADSTSTGYGAVCANGSVSCGNYGSGSAYFVGGNSSSEEDAGGFGILSAVSIFLYGKNMTIWGGDSEQFEGGCAVYAPDVRLFADDCMILGGDGPAYDGLYDGFGIYADTLSVYGDCEISGSIGVGYAISCYIGEANVTVSGSLVAFSRPTDISAPTWSRHVTRSGDYAKYTFRVNSYTLTLEGNGGTLATGAAFTSLNAYYPASHHLSHYIFQRSGYVQVAWTGGDTTYPLDTVFQPESSCTLSAQWLAARANSIILNGLSGTFPDGNFYEKYSNTAVTLPSDLRYDGGAFLIAWCTEVAATPDRLTQLYNGRWYAVGDTVSPSNSEAISLYAKAHKGGTYAVYHSTEGAITTGGSLLIQGTDDAATTSLTVYAPDASYLAAPEGYEFAGWAIFEDAYDVDYASGDPVYLAAGGILHLYARWENVLLDTDGLTISRILGANSIQVDASADWCSASGAETVICAVYDTDGKMLSCTVAPLTDEALHLDVSFDDTADHCKLFKLDSDHAPVGKAVTCELN